MIQDELLEAMAYGYASRSKTKTRAEKREGLTIFRQVSRKAQRIYSKRMGRKSTDIGISRTYRTSSLTVVPGNSGPHILPVSELIVSGEDVPYGEPKTFAQKMK